MRLGRQDGVFEEFVVVADSHEHRPLSGSSVFATETAQSSVVPPGPPPKAHTPVVEGQRWNDNDLHILFAEVAAVSSATVDPAKRHPRAIRRDRQIRDQDDSAFIQEHFGERSHVRLRTKRNVGGNDVPGSNASPYQIGESRRQTVLMLSWAIGSEASFPSCQERFSPDAFAAACVMVSSGLVGEFLPLVSLS